MQEISLDVWKRQGCSLIWEKDMLLPLVARERPHALREILLWQRSGFPTILARQTIVVTGLQTCLEVATTPDDAEAFLRSYIQPLIRRWQDDFPESGLVFSLTCEPSHWSFDAHEYGILTLHPNRRIAIVASIWNGAANQANKLVMTRQAPAMSGKLGKVEQIFGGIYVRRLS